MADNDISYLQPLAAVVPWCCGAVVPWCRGAVGFHPRLLKSASSRLKKPRQPTSPQSLVPRPFLKLRLEKRLGKKR
jgi:hypothetical protein